jgi:hypothetical protein
MRTSVNHLETDQQSNVLWTFWCQEYVLVSGRAHWPTRGPSLVSLRGCPSPFHPSFLRSPETAGCSSAILFELLRPHTARTHIYAYTRQHTETQAHMHGKNECTHTSADWKASTHAHHKHTRASAPTHTLWYTCKYLHTYKPRHLFMYSTCAQIHRPITDTHSHHGTHKNTQLDILTHTHTHTHPSRHTRTPYISSELHHRLLLRFDHQAKIYSCPGSHPDDHTTTGILPKYVL